MFCKTPCESHWVSLSGLYMECFATFHVEATDRSVDSHGMFCNTLESTETQWTLHSMWDLRQTPWTLRCCNIPLEAHRVCLSGLTGMFCKTLPVRPTDRVHAQCLWASHVNVLQHLRVHWACLWASHGMFCNTLESTESVCVAKHPCECFATP